MRNAAAVGWAVGQWLSDESSDFVRCRCHHRGVTVEEDIVAWARTRPAWEQEVLTALGQGEVFDDERVSALADRLLDPTGSTSSNGARNLTLKSATPKRVRLVRVCNLQGVNVLAEDQTLSFAPDGLTVIFGGNGSGKSGYARLIKGLASSRHTARVLPDVFKENAVDPTAELVYEVDGQEVSQKFPSAEPVSDLLQVRFFDEYCGDEYLTKTSTIDYRPSALALLDRLIEVCDRARGELDSRVTAGESRRLALDLPPETAAGTFIAHLSDETTDEAIEQATTLAPGMIEDLAAAVQEVERLRASDATRERARLHSASTEVARLRERLIELTSAVDEAKLTELRSLRDSAESKRAAAKIAASTSFDAEPLAGVGTDTWRTLWLAARDFSSAEAYHDHDFPEVGEGARCVLCHQLLDDLAKARFSRFSRYMTGTTERGAVAAEQTYYTGLSEVRDLVVVDQPMTAWRATLHAHDPVLSEEVEAYLTTLETRRSAIVAYLTNHGPLPRPIAMVRLSEELHTLSGSLEAKANATDLDGFHRKLTGASRRVSELQASVTLSNSVAAVKAEVARLREVHDLTLARKETETGPITQLVTSLTRRYATKLLQDCFKQETKSLYLDKVMLEDQGGRKGQVKQLPKLQDAKHPDAQVRSVLSEGEQNALGLAGFFTEVDFDKSQSAIVFDDPVTSLDHVRRGRVAERLAAFATDRQVIIFTHDIAFISDLLKVAEVKPVAVTPCSIVRRGEDTPGVCRDAFPWKVKDLKARLDALTAELARIKKDRPSLTDTVYEERVAAWAGRLSDAWETCVTRHVVDEVFDRGKSQVRPKMFRLLVKIDEKDNLDLQDGYQHTSNWATRHIKMPDINYVAPPLHELEQELHRIIEWQKRVAAYSKPEVTRVD